MKHENFVRYADDMMIFCRNRYSARQALKHITPYIEENLFLRINTDKTIIANADNIKFLGYGFFRTNNVYKIKIHEDSITRMKKRVSAMSGKSGNTERARQYVASWITHYRLADVGKFFEDINYSPK